MNRNLPIVLLITFIDFLSLSVFFGTIMPLVLAHQSVFHLQLSEHGHRILFGLILLILPLGQFLITPIWGQLSDQTGRKPILFITLLGSALGFFLMGIAIVAKLFVLFIIARIITACCASNIAIARASVADTSVGTEKTKKFNLQFIFVSLGFVVGPYVIKFTSHNVHYANPYWTIAVGYVIAFIFVMNQFQETLKLTSDKSIRWLVNLEQIFTIFKSPRLKQLFIIWMIFQLGWSLFFQYSGEFLYLQHHVSNEFINFLFSWVGLGILVIQIGAVHFVSKILSPQNIVPWAVGLIGCSLLLMGIVPIGYSFYALMAVYCVGIAFFLTNMNAYVSDVAAPDAQGRAMAMLNSSQSLMDIIVTLLGSFVVAYYLPTPYVIGGLIILISLLVWLIRKPG